MSEKGLDFAHTRQKWRIPLWLRIEFLFTENQELEIIKVRQRNSHIGPLTKVIPLNLFLDIVPNSSADITRVLRGCFRLHYFARFPTWRKI